MSRRRRRYSVRLVSRGGTEYVDERSMLPFRPVSSMDAERQHLKLLPDKELGAKSESSYARYRLYQGHQNTPELLRAMSRRLRMNSRRNLHAHPRASSTSKKNLHRVHTAFPSRPRLVAHQ